MDRVLLFYLLTHERVVVSVMFRARDDGTQRDTPENERTLIAQRHGIKQTHLHGLSAKLSNWRRHRAVLSGSGDSRPSSHA